MAKYRSRGAHMVSMCPSSWNPKFTSPRSGTSRPWTKANHPITTHSNAPPEACTARVGTRPHASPVSFARASNMPQPSGPRPSDLSDRRVVLWRAMPADPVIKDASFDRHDVERFDRWAGSYDRSFLQQRVFDPIHTVLLDALGDLK